MRGLADSRRLQFALAAVVCIASVLLLASRLHYGFLPEDDPALATIAERTLHGQLPNLDFYDNYTGGLTFLNALAMRLFGVNLISQRIMLLLFFIPWVPSLWYVARRVTNPLMASLLTLIGVIWSVPVYPATYGSWYNLFFATFGTATLFRYLDTARHRWIFAAGICGGLSFLSKISGLYFLAGAGLFLLYVEQDRSAQRGSGKSRSSAYSLFLTAVLIAFCGGLIRLVSSVGQSAGYYHFVLPGLALCLLIIAREWRDPRPSSLPRFDRTFRATLALGAGAALPVALFLIPYFLRHGVFTWGSSILLSSARFRYASHAPLPTLTALICVPLLLALWVNSGAMQSSSRRLLSFMLCIALGAILAFVIGRVIPSRLVWYSLAELVPLLVVAGCFVLWRIRGEGNHSSERLMLLLSVAGICSLIQFPYTSPMYFCFIVPIVLVALASLATETATEHSPAALLVPVLGFYLLFGVLAILPGEFYSRQFDPLPQAAFRLRRAEGFIADRKAVDLYEAAVPQVLQHAGDGPIYAGPDSPEMYFLTGRPNPTPVYLEFLSGSEGRTERLLDRINASGVRTVVINHGGLYNPSGPLPPQLVDALRDRFPESTQIGRFEIRWKP